MKYRKKENDLKDYLNRLGKVAVAFSAGVDSTFLLKTAHEVLGDNVIALTAKSPLIPERELEEAENFCRQEGIKHIIVDIDIDKIKHNPPNRCYICKKNIFENFKAVALAHNIDHVVEGSNIDDEGDYRPGMKAIDELGILSPLRIVRLTKSEIRELSNNQKPSFACLASRFAYNEEITPEKLKMVEQAEQILFEAGFTQFRVRMHGKLARVEVLPEEFEKLIRADIYSKFKDFGFEYITMDLKGYRIGSMNEVLKSK